MHWVSMFSPEIQTRLESLNRAAVDQPAAERAHRAEAEVESSTADWLSSGREVSTAWGTHWQIEKPLSQVWPAGPNRMKRVGERDTVCPIDTRPDLLALDRVFPHGIILLDLETCGLAGSMIFLAGLLYVTRGEFQLVQLWARDYSEEKPLLQSLWNTVQLKELLITYNGKSFDWTQVNDRSTLHHLGYRRTDISVPAAWSPRTIQQLNHDHERPEPIHLDLLHHARRRWRGRLPNFRLQTLERLICGRQRTGDIPGRDIPAAYHDYVRGGQLREVEAILHHNALDLVTLLQLVLVFLAE